MYLISQVYIIYVAVMLLFLLQMFMYYCLYHPEEGLIVLSRKRSICFALNKNVKSKKVAAYCFDMVLQINLCCLDNNLLDNKFKYFSYNVSY